MHWTVIAYLTISVVIVAIVILLSFAAAGANSSRDSTLKILWDGLSIGVICGALWFPFLMYLLYCWYVDGDPFHLEDWLLRKAKEEE